jgi:predicted membrane protein
MIWIKLMTKAAEGHHNRAMLGWLRGFVLCTSLSVMIIITAWPQVFGSAAQDMRHTAAMISMCGMSCGFVYGVGFIPRSRWLRLIFSAPVSLGLMVLGFALSYFGMASVE